ncbi:endonuclease/exonuclease/phosphatase family protein [Streptomyces omiyaensis]|uniref:endonuclease/exonuclease/phosphatase family protein n=1 Tax=Streptomyces omiyaensis TaxID=68247 RepID=UPI001677790D|nr:endonuclease/exonuclease/phosphatase family protein [Streptomyces omiyaensis]GGY75372.1 hypothetical protein GCM10010363_65570 [Streptomyces omiyaensis]
MRKRLVIGVLAAVVALLAGVVVATVAPKSPQAPKGSPAVGFTAWTWNVSGHRLNGGATDNGLVEAAVKSIRKPGSAVDFASFNEICYGQYRRIRAELAGWNPDNTNYARFQEAVPADSTDLSGAPICRGEAFGKAVFSRHALGDAEYRTFEQESGIFYRSGDGVRHPVRNGVLCVPTADRPAMKFCSVHIGPISTRAKPYGYRQLIELDTLLDGFARAGETYMVAGDFNARQYYRRLDRFYDKDVVLPGRPDDEPNRGAHRELDDTDPVCAGYGEWTADGRSADGAAGREQDCGAKPKIDMIFVRTDRLASRDYSADAEPVPDCRKVRNGRTVPGSVVPCSDHRAVVGRATLLVDPPAAE